MEVYFKEDYLKELYESGKPSKHYRFQPQIIRKYIKVINLMIELPNTMALLPYKGLHYEKLIGDKKGLSSVKVNDQYRIEFEEYVKEGETFATICNITELSNHYK